MAMTNIEKARPISLNDLEKLKAEIENNIKALINVPRGAIMWFHLTSAPEGWVVCDGTNGTPNLIGKYPLGSTSGIGNTVEAGLPNITGKTGLNLAAEGFEIDGAFYRQGNYSGSRGYSTEVEKMALFDASRCSPVYGKSDTVTPPSVKLLPCMKL